jgi:hypothetical protein
MADTELEGRDEIFNLFLQGIEESTIEERAALVSLFTDKHLDLGFS